MKLALIGVGSAGGRIANRVLAAERASGRTLCGDNVLLVDTSPPAFDDEALVPEGRRLQIGDVYLDAPGSGTDGDPDLGAEVAREDASEVLRAVDAIEFHEIDGVLVCAGLAGGTGGGAGAVVVDLMTDICDDPVYGLGVLPSSREGSEAALTAARSLRSFVEHADNVVLFDNHAWRDEERGDDDDAEATGEDGSSGSGFERVNDALATRVVSLFAAGEVNGRTVAENLMDPSDLMRTLDSGGVSAIGYAATEVEPERRGLLGRLKGLPLLASLFPPADAPFAEVIDTEADPEETTSAARIETLVKRAVGSRLTVGCDVSSADRALVLLSGPPRELSRKGFESSRYWIEQETDTVEVMAGDEPRYGTSTLSATVLLSTVTSVPRIEELKSQAFPDAGDFEFTRDAEVVEGVEP